MEHSRLGSPADYLIKVRHTYDQIIAAAMAIEDKAETEETVSRLERELRRPDNGDTVRRA